jgi:hypothetical protein
VPNYYEMLGVSADAEAEVIEAAYKALVRKYHPDRAGENQRIRQINDAYSCLRDPIKRKSYDSLRGRSSARETPSSSEMASPGPSSSVHQTNAPRKNHRSTGTKNGELTKRCPDCGRSVPLSATKCNLCGYWFRRGLYYAAGCSIAFVALLLLIMLIGSIRGEGDDLGVGTPDGGPVVPAMFQGTWAPVGMKCQSGNGLVVDGSSVTSRAGGDLVSLQELNGNSAELEFTMQDESGPFTYFETWTVSTEAQVLEVTSKDSDGSTSRFRKCGSESAAKTAGASKPVPTPPATIGQAQGVPFNLEAIIDADWDLLGRGCACAFSKSPRSAELLIAGGEDRAIFRIDGIRRICPLQDDHVQQVFDGNATIDCGSSRFHVEAYGPSTPGFDGHGTSARLTVIYEGVERVFGDGYLSCSC